MMKKKQLFFLLTFLIFSACWGQSNSLPQYVKETTPDSLGYSRIITDTLFNSRQVINIISLGKNQSAKYHIEICYSKPGLKKTSVFGQSRNAEAAVNGSFFDEDRGGGVTYLEVNDSIINGTRSAKLKWAKPNKLINGAVVITKQNKIVLEPAKPELYYKKSKAEKAVLIAGPLLLKNGKKIRLPEMSFVKKRHPRTCLGITKDHILLITIDGRSKVADGMSLPELQKFLLDLGCTDAINLDGGGSTAMWIRNKGIVNHPSDLIGERPVANALLIIKQPSK